MPNFGGVVIELFCVGALPLGGGRGVIGMSCIGALLPGRGVIYGGRVVENGFVCEEVLP